MTSTRVAAPLRLAFAALALAPLLAACVVETGDADETTDDRDDAVVTENANDKIAFEYFVSKGLTDVQAAGIVGNLDQESNMDPGAVQSGGPGRGIAQWSLGDRWNGAHDDNVAWYAAQHGASRWSLDLQLHFIWYELTTFGYGLNHLKAAKTVSAAVTAFQDYYEMCGKCATGNRLAHAKAALAQFGGKSGGPTGCSVDGVDGTCIDVGACAAKAGHVSTPGYCPGADNIECCTPSASQPNPPDPGPGPGKQPSGPSCSVGGVAGTCIDVSACAAMPGYESTPGHCPGAASEQCCAPATPCHVAGVTGACIDVGVCGSMGRTSTAGYCPGAANIQCCTP